MSSCKGIPAFRDINNTINYIEHPEALEVAQSLSAVLGQTGMTVLKRYCCWLRQTQPDQSIARADMDELGSFSGGGWVPPPWSKASITKQSQANQVNQDS